MATERIFTRAEYDAIPIGPMTLAPGEDRFGTRWRTDGAACGYVSEYRETTPAERAAHCGERIFIVYPVAVVD